MPYFTSVISKRALDSTIHLNQLDKRLPAASSWGARELYAFRVVVDATRTRVLPSFAEQSASGHDLISSNPALLALVQPAPANLPTLVETDLATRYGPTLGQFWASLADVLSGEQGQDLLGVEAGHAGPIAFEGEAIGDEDLGGGGMASSPELPPSKRIRKTVQHSDMVDSTQVQFGSSSPFRPGSQVSTQDDAFVSAEYGVDAAREVKTERLVACFLRHILYSFPYEDLGLLRRIECRTRLSVGVSTEGGWTVRAEDDGGLRVRIGTINQNGENIYDPPRLVYSYRVLFETKRLFQHIDEGRPTISDAWLGQMTAEALVGRLARKATDDDPK